MANTKDIIIFLFSLSLDSTAEKSYRMYYCWSLLILGKGVERESCIVYRIDITADIGEKILSVLLFFSQYYGRYWTDTDIMRDTGGRKLFCIIVCVGLCFTNTIKGKRKVSVLLSICLLFTWREIFLCFSVLLFIFIGIPSAAGEKMYQSI